MKKDVLATTMKEKIAEKKVCAALKELSCARCQTYTALPKGNHDVPAERVEWFHNKELKFTMLHPLLERTGNELCYLCDKIERKLCTI